MVIAAMAK